MYTIVIAIVLGICIWVAVARFIEDGGIYGFIAAGVITIVGFGVAVSIGTGQPTHRVVVESTPLHNLYDDSRLSGGFFLGTGQIGESEYIFYNLALPDGTIKPSKIYKYDVQVFVMEDGAEAPRYEVSNIDFVDQTVWKWGITSPDIKKIFHVPAGSVDVNFSLK